jgi:DinB superfamily
MIDRQAASTPERVPDKDVIRADLEATRKAYHVLLGSLSAEDWEKRTRNDAWKVGELMWHIAWGLGFFPRGVERCRKGGGFRPPTWIVNPINMLITRIASRGATKEGVARKYDANNAALLESLAEVRDDEWQNGAVSPFGQYLTVEEMFRMPGKHFEEHGKDIRAGLGR